jgi:sarcosine oxidase delta subunit
MECRDRKGKNEMRGASARIRESSWETWMARLNRRGNKTGDRNERMLIHACILLFYCFRRTTSYLIKSIVKYGTQLVKKRKKYHYFSLVQPAFFVNDTRRQRSMLVRILEENKTQRTVGNSIVNTESHVSFRVLLIAE